MSVDISYPHIEATEGQPPRLRRLPRVRVAQIVMDYLAHGWSVDEMCRQHSYLTPAEAHGAMMFYFDHREEIEKEIAEELKEVRESRASAPEAPFVLRMRAQGLR